MYFPTTAVLSLDPGEAVVQKSVHGPLLGCPLPLGHIWITSGWAGTRAGELPGGAVVRVISKRGHFGIQKGGGFQEGHMRGVVDNYKV